MDEKTDKQKVTKDMNIMEIIVKFPQTREVFMNYGFHCLGCHAAQFETLEQGAMVHGIDIDKFVKDLNEAADKPAEIVEEQKEEPKKESKENDSEDSE